MAMLPKGAMIGRKSVNTVLFLMVFAGALLSVRDAQAVQIKRVQTGEITYPTSSDLVDTAVLPYEVDTKKSIVLVTTSGAATTSTRNDYDYLFTPYFEDSQNLAIGRDYGNLAATARYHVIEFNDGVKVIHGFSSMDKDTKIKTITLPESVNSANCFVLVYSRGYINTATDTEVVFLKGDLLSDTQLQLTRLRSATEAGIAKTINITYQVVEFQTDATIRKDTVT
ncbi:MAG: hypothetical protein PHV59_10440, partial [Victivallales bacterium]|nr:hypothetical protein [Victivallales bacterium]